MNPQFCRTASDRNSARNEYIKNLQLETSNNLMNYNANQIFKQTGVLPPSITALLDTRSITEKYADTQKARVAVLSGLREITDGANANQIVSQIQGKDMITLLNNLPQIVAEIKPKWSLGITAPAFMGYWNNYQKALALNNGVSSYPIIQSNQLLTSIQGVLQNIQATLPTPQELQQLKNLFALLPKSTKTQMASKIIEDAKKEAEKITARADAISRMTEADPILLQERIQVIQMAIDTFPDRQLIRNLTQQAQIAVQLDKSPQEADNLADTASSELSLVAPLPLMSEEEAQEAGLTPQQRDLINSPATTKETYEQTGMNPPRQTKHFSQEEEEGSPSAMSDITTETFKNTPKNNLPGVFNITKTYQQFERLRDWGAQRIILSILIGQGDIKKKDIDYGEARNFTGLRKKNVRDSNLFELAEQYYNKKNSGGAQESKSSGEEPVEPTLEQLKKAGEPETLGTGIKRRYASTGGIADTKGVKHRIQGKGVNSHRTHAPTTNLTSGGNYYQKPKIDTSHKVEKVPSYIEFGKHVLHQHNLQGGILQIRRRSGTIINDLPRQAVGGKLKRVLITLTGTGSPSFEDINELNDSEKNLLNKIVKTCKIDQRLLVPTPNKNKEEQDFNRLQILSGEITAGNNNPQIVKELKTVLLRLKNVGRIPKKHAHEIMEDLLSLGY
jgi:hypothetical protein